MVLTSKAVNDTSAFSRFKIGFLYDRDNDWIYSHLAGLDCLEAFVDRYEFIETFENNLAVNFDVLFILGFTTILPEKVLSLNKLNLVIHESALPFGRGFSPVQWQILDNQNEIPVCLIEAKKAVDSGDIYARTFMALEGHELLPEIREAQANATKDLIISFLKEYPNVTGEPQKGTPTFFRRRTQEDDCLNPDESIRQQFNKFRIANNDSYPLYFEIANNKYILKIMKAQN